MNEYLASEERQRVEQTGCVREQGCAWPEHPNLCVNSCEQAHARNLSAKWRTEAQERASRGKYLGCPVCKREVLFQCHHDGMDYGSVELDLSVPGDAQCLND